MTKAIIKKATERHLSEFYDGYVLVACIAGRAQVVVLCDVSPENRSVLIDSLAEVLKTESFTGAEQP